MSEAEYVERGSRWLRPLQRVLLPRGTRAPWRFRVFGAAARVYRWLWDRGVRL